VSTLRERTEQTIRRRGLFRRGQGILVAVSGGLDSMTLLQVLHALAPKHHWRLAVAHFNHQLRGRSSDADERLVRRTAQKLGLPFVSGRADVRRVAHRRKLSMEMAARKARHDFLARTATRLGIPSVALAHHAEDQLELFFLRLFRGSGGAGLSGMKWRNTSPSDSRIALIRPLLEETKAALREYADAVSLPFREDASNACLDIQRNRIRHHLLPLLRRKYQPAVDRTVLRLMDIAGAEAEVVSRLAAEWLGRRKRVPFAKLPRAVQRRCVQLQLLKRHFPADFELVERLRTSPDCPVSISPNVAVTLSSRGKLCRAKAGAIRKSPPAFPVRPPRRLPAELQSSNGKIDFGGLKIRWRIEVCDSSVPPRAQAGREFFDADKVGSRLVLRHWQPGDRFQPIGMPVSVKLQDLFTNLKIPRGQRHALVVLTTARGELIWVEKLRISERFKLSRATNRRLQWQWKRP